MNIKVVALSVSLLSLGMAGAVQAAESFSGSGSTAIQPVLTKWAATYKENTGVEINYGGGGSGQGIKDIKAGQVAFGATDKPLTSEELRKDHLIQFPAIIIGIAPIVNLPGVEPGQMVLDGKVLADIYLGKITKWNDPAIVALNKQMKLPDLDITVVHRSDGSGTTFNFADYLSKVSPEWKQKVGADTAISWPVGTGGKGNQGVASFVQKIVGSIGYVEQAYAVENKLAYTRMINAAGKVVMPDMKTFQAAAANANYGKAEDFYLILTDQKGAQSWPITATTWVMLRDDAPKATNEGVVKFFRWSLTSPKAQQEAEQLAYVPLPSSTVKQIEGYWKSKLGL
ncbi:phosphate ABC transporter substrate-binding protein PstS [Acidithiobacillus sp.]|uniref:phosphate ABC transporter substrate-binding protein PstS n=1 Tax=Acidithiobacillus sp. TaxID=1872118 RepID=UPI0025C6E85D|nr:phosphate ABC transporter substrate-binding protein PstS [Acidithiobacillus sp.]